MRSAIYEAAQNGDTTTYGAVASQITVSKVYLFSSLLANLLGEIFEEEHSASRPALTALVENK